MPSIPIPNPSSSMYQSIIPSTLSLPSSTYVPLLSSSCSSTSSSLSSIRYRITLVLVLMIYLTSIGVHGKALTCGSSSDCPGVERCKSGTCTCPEMGVTFNGILCVMGTTKPGVNMSDLTNHWSTYYPCESSVHDYSPSLAIGYQLYGLLLHGSSLCASLVALWRLIRARRARYNLQTYAVVLVAMHGFLYTLHFAMNPTSLNRQRVEMYMISYMPAPIVVSLYNVTLLFLSDLTSMQLSDAKNASARSTAFISCILLLLFVILFYSTQSNQMNFYYAFWIIFLICSLFFTSKVGIRLRARLMYAPSSHPTRSKPRGRGSQGSGKGESGNGHGSRKDSPMAAGGKKDNTTDGGNGTTAAGTTGVQPYGGGLNISQLAVPADYMNRDSVQNIDISTNGTPVDGSAAPSAAVPDRHTATGGGNLGVETKTPTHANRASMGTVPVYNTVGSVAMVNNTTLKLANPSRNAQRLRQRIMRFVYGSLCFSIAWLFVLIVSIFMPLNTIEDYLLPLIIFRFFEECWCFLLLMTFWPPSVAKVAIARTQGGGTRDGSNGGTANPQLNGQTLGSAPPVGSQTRGQQQRERGVNANGSPLRDSRAIPLNPNRASMVFNQAPPSPKVSLHLLNAAGSNPGAPQPQSSPSHTTAGHPNGIGVTVVTDDVASPSHMHGGGDSFTDMKSPSGVGATGARTPGRHPSSRVPALPSTSHANQLSPVHGLPNYTSSPHVTSGPPSMLSAQNSTSPPVSGIVDPLLPLGSNGPSSPPQAQGQVPPAASPTVTGDNLAPPRNAW